MYYFIVYSSVTYATRIRNYFKNDGSYIGLLHTPAEISPGGCSYSVKVKQHNAQKVVEISRRFGFKIKGIYRQTESGSYVEAEV